MGVDGKMDVQLDVSKASRVSRLEVIEGPTGRRNRSAAEKAKIAAESLVPGAEVDGRPEAWRDAVAGLRLAAPFAARTAVAT